MNKKDLAYFKDLLSTWRKQLLKDGDRTVAELLSTRERAADLVDQATIDDGRNFAIRIRDREKQLIRKIDQALENIENGTFGICQECGEKISIERLKARPVATYCIECKKQKEALESLVE
ncbi:MAG: RNA polymerase-binding protein DksA [Deltaproteobacteria bacterium]|nr:RNA polymerase-binding protein DksA [Deltaproteobacteria bacterium]MBW1993672.1 RNA polymerase-binding protein DksA [Deltaproteobacteria bacterium]MBW2151359.1 RNA polymerase-binding protein DksA [Deltaproteobacteria bacterium]